MRTARSALRGSGGGVERRASRSAPWRRAARPNAWPSLRRSLASARAAPPQVYKGIDQSTGGVVAIKEISLEGMSADDLEGLQSEIDLLKALNHRNVVQYLGTLKARPAAPRRALRGAAGAAIAQARSRRRGWARRDAF